MQEDIQEDIIDCLNNIALFDKLNINELKIISKHMKTIQIKKGATLFNEGDQGNYVCFVADGKLDVIKKSDTHDAVVITTLSKGRSIGDISILDNFPRSATIKAQTDSKLITLSRKNFDIILDEYPRAGIKILKGMTRLLCLYLRKASGELTEIR